jgi:hypothetical protein
VTREHFGDRDPAINVSDPDWESDSGYRELKIVTKKDKNNKNFIFEEPEFTSHVGA